MTSTGRSPSSDGPSGRRDGAAHTAPDSVPAVFEPAAWPWFHYIDRSFSVDPDAPNKVHAELRYALAARDTSTAGLDEQRAGVLHLVERYTFHVATQPAAAGPMWAARWDVAERLLTHLWLVAGLSYYKASAAPDIRVHGPGIGEADLALHQLLLTRGLGEFCFVNGLPAELSPTWHTADLPEVVPPRTGLEPVRGPLVPVGGGKDSCVTIEALRAAGRTPTLVTVRRFPIIADVIADAGLPDLEVDRTLDPSIGRLNAAGALNGHVPATAIVSFAALIAAALGGHDALVMSNERSASEGNVEYQGVQINHQWAKSDEAEAAIAAALARVTPELAWFSLLRPLSELDIAQRFAATCQRYFESFSSCNRTQRIDPARRVTRWCGECPKCQFVYLALAPVLDRGQLESIWGAELFASSPRDGFEALLGLREWKPFECVGEHLECRVALAALVDSSTWSDHRVIRSLADAVRAAGAWPDAAAAASVYEPQPAPLVPARYRDVL